MRILHTNMLRGWGGQSNRILTEALGVAEAGHEVCLAVPQGSKLQIRGREAGLEILPGYSFRSPGQFWKFIPDVFRFARDVKAWKPDLIHLHGSQDTWVAVMAMRISGRRGWPVMLRTKHNLWRWKEHALNRWLYPQIDAYMSISGATGQHIDDFPGLASKPLVKIPSIPNLERLDGDWKPMREELKLPEGAFLWGSTARMRWEKGHDVLLRAFARVRQKYENAHLVLAGSGSELGALKELAGELGLLESGAAQFLGFREDVPAVLKSLDAYALASRSEGLGTSILEALACGLPVVATREGGIVDSVKHEETGLLVTVDSVDELASAMLRMMEDDELRERVSKRAKEFVREEFTREALVEKTLAFYQQLLAD